MINSRAIALIILCIACFCSVLFASGAIWYDLYIYSDFGDVTVDPAPTDGAYIEGTVVTITFTDLIIPEMAYTRFVYDGVVGYGDGSYTGSATTFQVTMNSEISEEVDWQIQYQVDFETAGISGATGSAVIVTVDGAPKTAAQLPFVDWYDSGSVVSYTYNSPVSGIYVLTGMTVSRVDASGHLITDTATGSYTVTTYATIAGLYTVTTTTATTSTTTTVSGESTSTSSATTTSGGVGGGYTPPATTPSGGLDILGIFGGFSETLRDFWGTISSWGSGTSGSGGLSIGTIGAWFNGSTYEIPHMGIVLLAILMFIILIVWRRRRDS